MPLEASAGFDSGIFPFPRLERDVVIADFGFGVLEVFITVVGGRVLFEVFGDCLLKRVHVCNLLVNSLTLLAGIILCTLDLGGGNLKS